MKKRWIFHSNITIIIIHNTMNKKNIFRLLSIYMLTCTPVSAQVLFEKDCQTEIFVGKEEKEVVHTALEILQKDVKNVFDARLVPASAPGHDIEIVAGTVDNPEMQAYLKRNEVDLPPIMGQWETFQIRKLGKKQVLVTGSDARGLAYGLLEISRMIGVSPWEWWADVTPDKRDRFLVSEIKEGQQAPSVQFRGIFLNDEDWGLTPWSTKNFEPEAQTIYPIKGRFKGQVGPKTYAKVFELLLRLRANTIWPAMHEVTMPFYFVEGNREMAERYGMVVSTSHCEPMMRNSATEWDLAGKGEYNFLKNRQAVVDYWTDRLKELKHSDNIFTVGMRGKHDGRMTGVKNTLEYKEALNTVLQVQDSLLRQYIHPDSKKIPQQFVPYKEVLDVYRAGLEVPDHITLVWPDDNFGYIRHFPDEKERQRTGGNGVYYHTSYWGEPHDFLWLGIVQPSLMYQQMKLAYDRNMRKIWVLNVGDIKPSEYLTEFFLDMAWDINLPECKGGSGIVFSHLGNWLNQTFGKKTGKELLPLMRDFYLLSHIRKPEFMGNTRTYDKRHTQIADLPWSAEEINERLERFKKLSDWVEKLYATVPSNRKEAYFEMIQYPVQASNEMNKKMLYAQFARHTPSDSASLWKKSDAAYDSIVSLTRRFNSLLNGKWNSIMSVAPRGLAVFGKVKHTASSMAMATFPAPLQSWNGTEHDAVTGPHTVIDGLGHSEKAIYLGKGVTVEYEYRNFGKDSLTVEVYLVPTHAVEGGKLRFAISTDDRKPQVFDCETAEYSEEWKANILRAQSVKTARFPSSGRKGRIKITALDEGVVIDQIRLR